MKLKCHYCSQTFESDKASAVVDARWLHERNMHAATQQYPDLVDVAVRLLITITGLLIGLRR